MEPISVYWAPFTDVQGFNTSHTYLPLRSVFEEIFPTRNTNNTTPSFFQCPATSTLMKNTFVVRSPVEEKIKVSDTKADVSVPKKRENSTHIKAEIFHQPSIENQRLVYLNHPLIMFSEEDLMATLTAPFFERSNLHNYGVVVPGQFNIGKWFRPLNSEVNLWSGLSEIELHVGDALCYIQMQTERPINLRRFQINKRLTEIALGLVHNKPLSKLARMSENYRVFDDSKLRKIILKEITENLLDD